MVLTDDNHNRLNLMFVLDFHFQDQQITAFKLINLNLGFCIPMGVLGIDAGSPFFSPINSGTQSPTQMGPYSPQLVSYKPGDVMKKQQNVFNFNPNKNPLSGNKI